MAGRARCLLAIMCHYIVPAPDSGGQAVSCRFKDGGMVPLLMGNVCLDMACQWGMHAQTWHVDGECMPGHGTLMYGHDAIRVYKGGGWAHW